MVVMSRPCGDCRANQHSGSEYGAEHINLHTDDTSKLARSEWGRQGGAGLLPRGHVMLEVIQVSSIRLRP